MNLLLDGFGRDGPIFRNSGQATSTKTLADEGATSEQRASNERATSEQRASNEGATSEQRGSDEGATSEQRASNEGATAVYGTRAARVEGLLLAQHELLGLRAVYHST